MSTATETEQRLYKVPDCNLPGLQEQIAVINKTAAKLGVEPVALVKVGSEIAIWQNRAKVKYEMVIHHLHLEGTTPKFAGWSLVAVIEMLGDERMVRVVPGQECPVSFREGGMTCDHCGHERRRKEVLILKHEDGTYKQVGKTCVADFLGGTNPEDLIAWAQFVHDLEATADNPDWEEGGGYSSKPGCSIEEYLGTVAVCIRRLGWVSGGAAQQDYSLTSTSSVAWRVCTDNSKTIAELIKEKSLIAEEQDEKLAAEALAWGQSHPTTAEDYLYNLGVACRAGIVGAKTMGIIASVIASYQRHLDRVEQLNLKAKEPNLNEHIGEIKERRGFKVTVKRIKYFPSDFTDGSRMMIRMKDEEGRTLMWWTSVRDGEDHWMEQDKQYEITGTIKSHEVYQEWKNTVLTRVAEGLPKPKKAKKK